MKKPAIRTANSAAAKWSIHGVLTKMEMAHPHYQIQPRIHLRYWLCHWRRKCPGIASNWHEDTFERMSQAERTGEGAELTGINACKLGFQKPNSKGVYS